LSSAVNLCAFSRLHSSFAKLSPLELKERYLSDVKIELTGLRAFEAYRIRDAGSDAGFKIIVTELDE